MSIRECALQSQAFAALKNVFENRDAAAKAWRAAGKKVVVKVGCDVPDELVMAAGMLPVQVYTDPAKPLVQTDIYLEHAFEPVVRAQFERLVDGTYNELADYIVVSNSTDVVIRIFLYLRELKRVEPEKPIPPVAFIDWLFTRKNMHQRRNEYIIRLFKKQLEEWCGYEITEEQVREAALICNENRQALRAMAELRHGEEVRISGSEAQIIIGAGLFMEKAEHTALVRQVTEDAKSWPVLTGKRVFYTGANHEDTALYEKIEQTGLVIVGEDTDWGDRYYERDYNTSLAAVHGVVDRYMFREYSAKKATVTQRVGALDREVNAVGAEGVIFYTNKYDEVATFDMPKQRMSLESRGIKHVTFGKMKWPVAMNEGLDEKLAEFANELKGGA